ncbi:IclR family transcriptional regulator domain-containing protein [Nocardioides marmoraquaticus]
MPNTAQGAGPLPGDDFVQSLARGIAVITCFDAEHGRLTLSEVAERTGLTRATARRLLLTLAQLGYVRVEGRLFALTPQVLQLGTAYLSGMGLPEVAQPHLEQLTARTGESSSVAVLDGDDIVYVARVATTHRLMRAGITVGTRFPAHATSMGRVLLAALPEAERSVRVRAMALDPLTERTTTDPDALLYALRRVAGDGHALVDQELEPGLRSLAVPVRHRGAVVGALNVSLSAVGPAETALGLLPDLESTARAVGADLDLTR